MDYKILQDLLPPHPQELRGCFTGTVLSSPQRCTATDSCPCHIIAQIPVCNEFLYNVQLELQEFSPGHLCLVPFDYEEQRYQRKDQIEQAFRLLACLLQNHRCIASLYIQPSNCFPEYEAMISSSYRPTTALKSLRLGAHDWRPAGNELLVQAVTPTLSFLTGLEELDCVLFAKPPNLIEPLCRLLKKSSTLKKLALTHWSISPAEAAIFRSGLSNNSTLTNLSINWSCIMPRGADYSGLFGAVLEKHTILKTLSVLCDINYRLGQLECLIDAVGRSKSLVNLTLSLFRIVNEDGIAIQDYLTGNSTLRSFIMKCCRWYPERDEAVYSDYSPDTDDVHSTRIHAWMNILRTNHSLQELRLNLSAFPPTDWPFFFAALENNTGLKEVVVEGLDWYFHCRGILACGSLEPKKVNVPPPSRPDVIISKCKQLSNIGFWIEGQQDVVWFGMVMSALSSCSHVTKLTIDVHRAGLEHDVEDLIADYIKNTIKLKDLRLVFSFLSFNVSQPPPIKKIIAALKDNCSIRTLFLAYRSFSDEEAFDLTSLVKSSKRIYDLEILTNTASTKTLVNQLSPKFSANYTLVSLRCLWRRLPLTRHYYYVKDIVRRNNDLVMRAAQCVTGNHSRRCTEALELVAENPALVEKICEHQSLGEKDAAQVVRNTRDTLLGLNEFMRITGVVKERVRCKSSQDPKVQLEDIDEYSWLQVRRLLRLSDVLPCT